MTHPDINTDGPLRGLDKLPAAEAERVERASEYIADLKTALDDIRDNVKHGTECLDVLTGELRVTDLTGDHAGRAQSVAAELTVIEKAVGRLTVLISEVHRA